MRKIGRDSAESLNSFRTGKYSFEDLLKPEAKEKKDRNENYNEPKIAEPVKLSEQTKLNIQVEEQVLKEALSKAKDILDTAREEAENIRKDAYESGYKKGYEEGHQKGEEDVRAETQEERDAMHQKMEDNFQEFHRELTDFIKDASVERDKLIEKYIDDLKNIAIAVGEKIIRTSLKSSDEVVRRMIIGATEKMKKTAWANIYVSKDLGKLNLEGDEELLRHLSNLSEKVKIVIIEDEEPGTCIIEMPDKVLDASINSQLENIKDIINNARI